MERLYSIIKRTAIIILGFIWGCVSFFWLGYSILTLGNLIEEPGSIDYVAEGEAMRIYGLIGCVLYAMVFVPVLFSLYKQKQSFNIILHNFYRGKEGQNLFLQSRVFSTLPHFYGKISAYMVIY